MSVTILSKAAVKMLRRVENLALDEPKKMSMSIWLSRKGGSNNLGKEPKRGYLKCGKVGCIGGWVEELNREDHPRSRRNARAILGLDTTRRGTCSMTTNS